MAAKPHWTTVRRVKAAILAENPAYEVDEVDPNGVGWLTEDGLAVPWCPGSRGRGQDHRSILGYVDNPSLLDGIDPEQDRTGAMGALCKNIGWLRVHFSDNEWNFHAYAPLAEAQMLAILRLRPLDRQGAVVRVSCAAFTVECDFALTLKVALWTAGKPLKPRGYYEAIFSDSLRENRGTQ